MTTKRATPPLALRRHEVAELLGLSAATVQRLVVRGDFPAPRKLCDRSVAWPYAEVVRWLESRPVSDLPPPPRAAAA